MTVGINVDGSFFEGAPPPDTLKAAGFGGVRLTHRSDPGCEAYIESCLASGLWVVAIQGTGDAAPYPPPFHQKLIIQVDNEIDIPPTYKPPNVAADDFAIWRGTYPAYNMWTTGLASGHPDYFAEFLSSLSQWHSDVNWPNAVAMHPYWKNGDGVRTLAEEYWNITGAIPVVSTEWYWGHGQDQIYPVQDAMDEVCSVWNSWYCWSNLSNPGFGLIDQNGVCRLEGEELISRLHGNCPEPYPRARQVPPPEPPHPFRRGGVEEPPLRQNTPPERP